MRFSVQLFKQFSQANTRKTDMPHRQTNRPALRVVILYAAVSAVWILLSDRALAVLIEDPELYQHVQTYKGWFFVAVTAFLLFVLIRNELARRTRLEEEIFARDRVYTKEITASLAEKDALLREVHHRVKNNLQIITSLLNLQKHGASDPELTRSLEISSGRVYVIALLHEQLYRSERISSISMQPYLQELCARLLQTHADPQRIGLTVNPNDVEVNLDAAVPLGLVCHEIVSNALRHAFPRDRTGHVFVSLTLNGGTGVLEVVDDGIGLPGSGETHGGIGLSVVQALSNQIGGEAAYKARPESGTSFKLTFPV